MNRIKDLRKEKGISQAELAKLTNTIQATVSGWENGHIFPRSEALLFLADYFEVSIDYLIGRTDDMGIIHPAESTLNRDEIRMLQIYRTASEEDRKLIYSLIERCENPK